MVDWMFFMAQSEQQRPPDILKPMILQAVTSWWLNLCH